jgi:hypothetical protein
MTEVSLPDSTDTVRVVSVSGPITNVPEFHDCQRFIVGGSFDSLYAIFARYQLESLPGSLVIPPATPTKSGGNSGGLVARGAATVPTRSQVVFKLPEGTGYTYAEIYTWGGNYPDLGIQSGFNCLYMFRTDGRWRARMVPIANLVPSAPQDSGCLAPQPEIATAVNMGKELLVMPDTQLGRTDSDYPPVSRWDWDSVHSKQYIGIRCGAAWCEVGDSDLVVSNPLSSPPTFETVPGAAPTSDQNQRVTRIKGWYDRQLLATHSWLQGLHPSVIWGEIIPHPVLGRQDHDVASYFHPTSADRRWVEVAVVRVSANYTTSVMRFTTGDNKVYLCYGTDGDCGVPSSQISGCKASAIAHSTYPASMTSSSSLWWAMVKSEGIDLQYRCVEWRDHSNDVLALGFSIPGTARWRWLLDDETNWMRCTEGCCEIH